MQYSVLEIRRDDNVYNLYHKCNPIVAPLKSSMIHITKLLFTEELL